MRTSAIPVSERLLTDILGPPQGVSYMMMTPERMLTTALAHAGVSVTEEVRSALLAALAAAPDHTPFLTAAAADAGVVARVASERIVAICLLSSAVNLGDDQSDGRCSYLDPRLAP